MIVAKNRSRNAPRRDVLIGPLAADARDEAGTRDGVQTLTHFALRAIGVPDARARGLVVQTRWPGKERVG